MPAPDPTADLYNGGPKGKTDKPDIAEKGVKLLSQMILSSVIWQNYQSLLK